MQLPLPTKYAEHLIVYTIPLFIAIQERHWEDISNRIAFFSGLANKHGIDPLVPEQWYHFNHADLSELEVLFFFFFFARYCFVIFSN